MKALITGASSGIGKDMAYVLAEQGWELILVARRTHLLEQLAQSLPVECRIIAADLSDPSVCRDLYEKTKDDGVDLLINNAGFGLHGEFVSTDLQREEEMIDLNIKAVHILTKLFAKDFSKRNSGYILNVASAAAFTPGPLMDTYYATKVYVLRLGLALREELRRRGSKVVVSTLCPGPVDTDFNNVAGVRFSLPGLNSRKVAEYAIAKTLRGKAIIIPGFTMKLACVGSKLLPATVVSRVAYLLQRKKGGV
ncbi:MAG: SDR family oxidoreductase [Oscillospiraceae bacterium]|nr:SDR family oxidoreductase [Oscillospiraceae bacterium]